MTKTLQDIKNTVSHQVKEAGTFEYENLNKNVRALNSLRFRAILGAANIQPDRLHPMDNLITEDAEQEYNDIASFCELVLQWIKAGRLSQDDINQVVVDVHDYIKAV